jgi:hypothetical protein
MAIKTGKAKKMNVSSELKKLYEQAVNSTEVYSFLAPAKYDEKTLLAELKNKKLYRPLLIKFKLI